MGKVSTFPQCLWRFHFQMGFFKKLEKCPKKVKIDDFTNYDKENAHKLFRAITQTGRISKIRRRTKISIWYRDFNLLLTEDLGNKKKRLTIVLDWYCSHIQDKYSPWVWSAKSFRQKFIQIEEVMKRYKVKHQKIKHSKYAKKVLKRLLNYFWAQDNEKELLDVIQISLDNYERFEQYCPKVGIPDDRTMGEYIYRDWIGCKENFIPQWFELCLEQFLQWPNWNKKASTLEFRVDKRMFRTILIECAGDGCYQESIDQFIEALKDADSKNRQ